MSRVGRQGSTGHEIVARPVTIPDLLATIYHALGVDPERSFTTPAGQPVRRLEGGTPVLQLFA